MTTTRPDLDERLTGSELRRWYWLRTELAGLARTLGVSTAGGKIELTDRLAAALDGHPYAPPPAASVKGSQLVEPLTDDTVIPAGQRSSQALRRYFVSRLGPGFRFDHAMREFIATGEGRTLGAAVEHWHASRTAEPTEIAPQFELNRFTRAWHEAHPGGSRTDLMTAWREHRALPVEARSGPSTAR